MNLNTLKRWLDIQTTMAKSMPRPKPKQDVCPQTPRPRLPITSVAIVMEPTPMASVILFDNNFGQFIAIQYYLN